VTGLIDKSVLVREECATGARYRILETIRQYGQERLAKAEDTAALRRRHRDYYLHLAEQADADSSGPRQPRWAERLRVERANLFAALDYCLTVPGQERDGLRLGAALWFYWIGCGFVRDGRYWLDRALQANSAPSRDRARGLWINGWIATLQGDYQAALVLLDNSRDLAQQQGDDTALTYATQHLGWARLVAGDPPQAIPLLDHVLVHHRASARWTAPAVIVFPMQIFVAGLAGDTDQAMDLLDECRKICASLGERWALSWALNAVGIAWWTAGNSRQAAAHLCECLRVKRDVTDQLGYPFGVDLLSWIAAAEGDWTRAAVLQGAADKMWEPINRPLFGFDPLIAEGQQWRTRTHEALGERAYHDALQHGARMSPEQAIACALGE
jgi:tetratricopeptide (TPR) repeat protein